jgi:hypothetical protein
MAYGMAIVLPFLEKFDFAFDKCEVKLSLLYCSDGAMGMRIIFFAGQHYFLF